MDCDYFWQGNRMLSNNLLNCWLDNCSFCLVKKLMKYVVETDWLAENLDNADIVTIDCRFSLADPELGRQKYLESHIPSAHYLDLNQDLSSPVQKYGGRHPLPNSEVLATKFTQMGIEFGKTLVVAYDDSRLAFAARLWWLLRYYGHDQVAVLNGGYPQWLKAGLPVSAEKPVGRAASFLPQVQQGWIVPIEAVSNCDEHLPIVLIDSREADRYAGIREPIDPYAGRISGSYNYPWQEVTDADGLLLSESLQRQRWQDLPENKTNVLYCGSGVTACVNALSLVIGGYPEPLLYPGGWSDWCAHH
jgi:thiosulfate/3-mercaptopyruvate sulfurtransferase